jgi:preprotein translocase subunit SecE
MAPSEATQQANRAEMDPRRLVVVAYLVFGVIITMFLGRMIVVAGSRLGINGLESELLPSIDAATLVGFLITLGIGIYTWVTPKIRSLSLEVASELMRVTWPTWDDVRVSTLAVVAASVIASLLLFGMDTLSYKLMVEWLPGLWGAL